MAAWLNAQLHFPHWDAISRDETKIGDWARADGVPMDKMYATEHREGGAVALGKDIPYVERERLNVFPDSEWERRKDRLELETWWRLAHEAIASNAARNGSGWRPIRTGARASR